MSVQSHLRKVAPFWDRYDSVFAGILIGLIVVGYATFMETASVLGLATAWTNFIKNSGLIALLTAWTAIIALYRLRHRPDKTRPAVREDFENGEREDATDFGLRNFGPGPALYVQAIATVEQGDTIDEVVRFQAQESPIHLCEGDFASLVLDTEENWLDEMAEKYEIGLTEADNEGEQENPPTVNLYFSYVSQSGAREPTNISTEWDDDNILDELKDPDAKVRNVELWRVISTCRNTSYVRNSPD